MREDFSQWIEKIFNMAIFAHLCMFSLSQRTIYICMAAVKRGFLFLKLAGEAMAIIATLVKKLAKTLVKKKESWGILSVSASYLSGYFDPAPLHWCALPAQSADERSWCTAFQKTIRQSCKGCSSYTHDLSQLFWCTWSQFYQLTGVLHISDSWLVRYTSQTADWCATHLRQLISALHISDSWLVRSISPTADWCATHLRQLIGALHISDSWLVRYTSQTPYWCATHLRQLIGALPISDSWLMRYPSQTADWCATHLRQLIGALNISDRWPLKIISWPVRPVGQPP